VIVVDASLVLDIVMRTAEADRLLSRLATAASRPHAPELLDIEVLQALRRQVRLKRLTPARAAEAVALLGLLPIARRSHDPLRARIWQLRDNLTAYDAAYVALAEALKAPLWTRDSKFSAAPGLATEVVVV